MSDIYQLWKLQHPNAAADLESILTEVAEVPNTKLTGCSEAKVQQAIRMDSARAGGVLWRNNVGSSKAKEVHVCPKCRFKFEVPQAPVRWGLCNDSTKLNERMKSSDLIGIREVLITQGHVGQTIGQFVAIEVKEPGWSFNPNDSHQQAQAAYLALVAKFGGYAQFSTGNL